MSLDAWREAGSTFPFRGHRIFYASGGQGRAGEALLLIHGFPTASWDWHLVWPALVERFRVVAPDMLGFGFSARPRGHAYRIAEQADLHEDLCALLAVERVHVLAHDYGDTVTQELLARTLEGSTRLAIRSVCFLNGGLFPESHRARPVQKLLAGPLGPVLSRLMNERSFSRSFPRIFGPRTQPSREMLHDLWRLVNHEGGARVAHDLLHYLEERRAHRSRWVGALQNATRRAGIPLRFVNGPEDPVSGAHMLTRYRALVPDADWVSLQGIGHYPQLEDPRGVVRAWEGFLQRHDLLPD